MRFELTEEQKMLKDMVRRFAEEQVKPRAKKIDEEGQIPRDIIEQLAELGLFGVHVPEEYGGSGMDYVSYAIVIEELSRACASTGVLVSAHTSLVVDPILKFGTEEQKRKYLVPLAKGEKIGAHAMTEPGAGTDVTSISTTARKEGDYYVINGVKHFITNGREADIFLVFAYTDKEKKHKGISAFIVERGTPGFTVGKLEHKLGIRGSSTAELIFEDCKVPASNLLGEEGQGFYIAMECYDGGRVGIAAQAVGIAQAAYEDSLEFAKTRVQFGQPIANFQAIQFKLADMVTLIEAARLLYLKAAWLKDQGIKSYYLYSAMAKLFASDVAMRVTREAIQIHGGYGYTTDYNVERYYRDAKITEIYEGTVEAQRLTIARAILKGI
ncbi:MAG: acyl-CoA dehydrogenase [Thermosulfidibacteraceae bacterium]|jgi:acyl-CoA dehydrogenase